VRPYLARFLFRDDEAFQEVSTLSGGQRSRLALARLLITEPNVLVLDEPTTHLDIATREALEKVLLDYEGTIIAVSHDRHFISLIARRLWIIEDGGVTEFAGTFAEWEQKKLAEAAPPPRPVRVAPQRRVVAAKPKPKPKPVKVDLSQVIDELETRLAKIESDLEAASAGQDVPSIVRLGEEHESVRQELEQKWQEWTR
jgi:ATP-binding cassette subfamily F protein 3